MGARYIEILSAVPLQPGTVMVVGTAPPRDRRGSRFLRWFTVERFASLAECVQTAEVRRRP